MKIENQIQMYEGSPWCLGRYESFEINKTRLITLLNHDYVIWKDKQGNLNAEAKKNRMNPFVNDVMVQCFNSFLPSLLILTNEIAKGKLFVAVAYGYPESPTKTRFCLDGYLNFKYAWWHKLLKFPQKGNNFRDILLFEDLNILNNLYPTLNKKIALKKDTPAELAMNYLKNWND